MLRTDVDSESLRSVGYDAVRRVLEVQFHNGSVYRYDEVPPARFHALMQADSMGAYFNRHIRDRYRTSRLL